MVRARRGAPCPDRIGEVQPFEPAAACPRPVAAGSSAGELRSELELSVLVPFSQSCSFWMTFCRYVSTLVRTSIFLSAFLHFGSVLSGVGAGISVGFARERRLRLF